MQYKDRIVAVKWWFEDGVFVTKPVTHEEFYLIPKETVQEYIARQPFQLKPIIPKFITPLQR